MPHDPFDSLGLFSRRDHRRAPRRRVRRRRAGHARLAWEPLEPRRVLAAAASLDAGQTAALLRGVTTFVDQLSFVQATGVLAERAVGVEQPLGTLVTVADEFRTGLVDPLASRLVGPLSAERVEQAFTEAVAADGSDFLGLTVSSVLEGTTVWFTLDLAGSRVLEQYALDVGQAPATLPGGESLADRGLRMGLLEADVTVGLRGKVAFGVDLTAGLAAETAVRIKIHDALRVSAAASQTAANGDSLEDVDVAFGPLRLGPADIDVAFDVAAEVGLASAAPLSLGELLGGDAASLFTVAAAADGDFNVSIPFTLATGGFHETGDSLTLGIAATDLFHASDEMPGIDFVFPTLRPLDGTADFSFEQFGDVSPTDLSASLALVRQMVPGLLGSFELPVVGATLGEVFAATASIDAFVDALHGPGGLPTFDTIDDLVAALGEQLGTAAAPLEAAAFNVRWNAAGRSLEYTLPLAFDFASDASAVRLGFDAAPLLPAGLPIDLAGRGTATFKLDAGLAVTAGILATSAPGLPDRSIDVSATLADVVAGFTIHHLVHGDDPGDDPVADLVFCLHDGEELPLDLNPILDADSDGAFDAGVTIGAVKDAIAALDPTRLAVDFVDGRFTLTDLTVGAAPFGIRRGEDAAGNVSLAPLSLGLAVAPTDTATLDGLSLKISALRDRIYLGSGVVSTRDGVAGPASITVDLEVDGGASIGPLSLSVYEGVAAAEAAVTVTLAAAGADADGRITLQEIDDAGGVAAVVSRSVATPVAKGVFQLKPTPEALESALEIGTYQAEPLVVTPDTATVPYFSLVGAGPAASTWDFTLEPSEKLRQLFEGLPELSMADLPGMFELFVGELEGLSFWNIDLPLVGLSLGDIFAFRDVVLAFPELDIGGLLKLPNFGSGDGSTFVWPELSFGSFGTGFLEAFDLALPSLGDLDIDLFALQSLRWDLGDLLTEWEGWAPGDLAFDLDFLGRLRNWGLAADIAFDPLFALPEFNLPDFNLPALSAALDGITGFLSGLSFSFNVGGLGVVSVPFGLGGFGSLIDVAFDLAFPEVDFPGLDLTVTPVTGADLAGRLLFDLVVSIAYDRTIDVSAVDLAEHGLDVGGVPLPLAIEADGTLVLALDGSFATRIGWNLTTSTAVFDLERTVVDVTAAIESRAPSDPSNPGVILAATIGGMSAISLGANAPDGRRATLTLSDPNDGNPGDGLAPAFFFYGFDDESGAMQAEARARLAADLPLYVAGLQNLGAITLVGTLDTTATPPFELVFDYVPVLKTDGQPYYASIADILAAATFNPDLWKELICQFTTTLTNGVANDFLGRLPFLGSFGFFDGEIPKFTFFKDICRALDGVEGVDFDTPQRFVDTLSPKIEQVFVQPGTGQPGSATPRFVKDNGEPRHVGDGNGEIKDWSDLAPTDAVIIDLVVSGGEKLQLAAGDLDIGLDGLGIEVDVGASLDLTFTLSLGLGFSVERGFFVESLPAADSPEVIIAAALRLDHGAIKVGLGPLTLSAEDSREEPELVATIPLDLGTDKKRSYLTDLPELLTGATILTEGAGYGVEANLAFALSANVFADGVGFGADLALGYAAGGVAGGGAVPFNQLFTQDGGLDTSNLYFSFTNVGIDLGGLLGGENGPIRTMMAKIAEALEPVQPIIDLLTADVPLVSDLSQLMGQGRVTFLTLVNAQNRELGKRAEKFLSTVESITSLAEELVGIAKTGRVLLGGLTPKADSLARLAGGTVTGDDFENPSEIAPSTATSADGKLDELKDLGLAFPILDKSASQLFGLLFGRDIDLVTWDVPDLAGVGFSFDQSFPIFGPLFARVFGSVGFSTLLDVGYDTRGIRQALAGDEVRLARTVNGFYFDDHRDAGNDLAEASLAATIGAGAELNVAVAKAGVDGGLRGEIGADLRDPNSDGKVHLDEIARLLERGPQCIFDFKGSLDVFLGAYLKLGFDTPFGFVTLFSDRLNLLEVELFNWTAVTCPPAKPDLADVIDATALHDIDPAAPVPTIGALVLNMGSRASLDDRDDEAEEFTIEQARNADDTPKFGSVVVKALEFEEEFEISSFDVIWFDAGLEADIVTIASDILTAAGDPFKPRVWGDGGSGNDQLTGGRGQNTFFGGQGDDRLIGHNDRDHLEGGDGSDILIGYGGSDTLVGDDPEADYGPDGVGLVNDGDDQLYGDDQGGDMADVPPAYAGGSPDSDDLFGGGGNDVAVGGGGGDIVRGGAGDDTISGGDGDDTLVGNAGNDRVSGGVGQDTIFGDDAPSFGVGDEDDRVSEGDADTNADFLEGGAGYNFIAGGPGNDTIYAHSEDVGLDAPDPGSTSSDWASWLIGDDGSDTLYGTAGKDRLEGGFQSDALYAGVGDDLVIGGPGGDLIVHRGTVDQVLGGLFGGHGNDVIDGGDGRDYVEGGPGDDRIFGRLGADEIYGGSTWRGYQYLLDDWATGRTILTAEHGGFTAVAGDGCEPDVSSHPEFYPEAPNQITATLYEDENADGIQDPGDNGGPADVTWGLKVVDAGGSWLVYRQFPGGVSTITGAGVPDGTYAVSVDTVPFGWHASTERRTAVTVAGGEPGAVAFGFWRPGRITGQVTRKQGNEEASADGVTVYIDADADGEFDADEESTVTFGGGQYTFHDVTPGDCRVAIAGLTDDQVLTPDFRQVTVTSGDTAENVDFEIVATAGPVVTAVFVGEQTPGVVWTPIPDGPRQHAPLVAETGFTRLAVDIATAAGIQDGAVFQNGATLQPVTATGVPIGAAVRLVELGSDPIVGRGGVAMERFHWAINSKTEPVSLAAGWYRLALDPFVFRDVDNDLLDGEWANPTPAITDGSRFPSGDGKPGGGFSFTFQIGGGSTMAASATAPFISTAFISAVSPAVAVGTGVIQGVVTQRDSFSTGPQAQGGAPLPGRTVVLVEQATGLERTTVSGPLDLDGDGRIAGDEAAAFRFTGLAAGDYSVRIDGEPNWSQVGGGTYTPGKLVAATFDEQTQTAALSTIDVATLEAELLTPLPNIAPRDVAALSTYEVFVTGGQLAATGVTPLGQGGLWRVSTWGGLTDLGPTPQGKPLVALDAYDGRRLIGADAGGEVSLYDVLFAEWTPLGPLTLDTGARVYPVGDFAVGGPDEVYAICVTVPVADLDLVPVNSQVLVRFDPTRQGATATVVRSLVGGPGDNVSELLVGLETHGAGLLGVGRSRVLYEIPTDAIGAVERLGPVADLPQPSFGGLARTPGSFMHDYTPGYDVTLDGSEGGRDGLVDLDIGLQVGLVLEDGDDIIDGGCGTFADVLYGDDRSLPFGVTSRGGNDVIRGRDGDDRIYGGLKADILSGDAGVDTIEGGTTGRNWIDGGADGDSLTGGGRDDVIVGRAGRDTLTGGDGDDNLFGGADADELFGGRGDDVLVAGAGEDVAGDFVSGGDGADTVYVIDVTLGGSFAEQPTGAAQATYAGDGDTDTIIVVADLREIELSDALLRAYGDDIVDSIEVALLTGGAGVNEFDASAFTGSTVLRGGDADDDLVGGSGADQMYGGTGSNRLVGNDGDDRFFLVDGETAEIVETTGAGSGADTVDASGTAHALAVRVGNLVEGVDLRGKSSPLAPSATFSRAAIERVLLGTAADSVTLRDGQATAAAIDAGGGSDMLTYDDLTGGWGAWGSSVEVLLDTGAATGFGGIAGFERVIGGDGDDFIRGDDLNNRLEGGDGHDHLFGGDSDDTLIGGGGENLLGGNAGNDIYWFVSAAQTDTLLELGGQGTDELLFEVDAATPVTVTIGGTIQAAFGGGTVKSPVPATIERIRGGAAADRFIVDVGSGFAGVLDGGATPGADFADMDTLDYSRWVAAATVDFSATVGGTSPASGTGGVIGIHHVVGGGGGDRFTGGAAAVWFEGNGGVDTLVGSLVGDRLAGGTGADTLDGRAGDDAYVFAAAFGNDTILEAAGGGTDRLDFAAVATPLEVRIGSVTVSDGTSTARHENAHVERVIGGSAADLFVMTGPSVVFPGVLDGGGGADRLRYDNASQAIIDGVAAGQTPNVGTALSFEEVTAINNLHAPVFGGGFTGAIPENAAITTIAYTATANDADISPGNRITYSLKPGLGDDADLMTIEPASGKVRLKAAANFEAKNAYRFTVVATDSGLPPRASEQAITVNVLNVAEPATPPRIAAPGGFVFTEDTPGVLRFPTAPFSDADSAAATIMTVTLGIADGSILAAGGGGVVVGGTPTARTFTGTLANLNAFFTTAPERISYAPAANVWGERRLSISIAEGPATRRLSSTAGATVTIGAVNDAPVAQAPVNFSVSEDLPGNIVWPRATPAVADVDSTRMTVTLSVDAGTITASSTGDVTVGGTPAARTFAGTPAAVTKFFSKLGRIRFTAPANDTANRTLTMTASDGAAVASLSRTIRVAAVNDPPTLAAAIALTGAVRDTPLEITHATLLAASAATDIDSQAISFQIESLRSGTLQKWDGSAWKAVSLAANAPAAKRRLEPGQKIRWIPKAGVVGDVPAFIIRAWDGAAFSTVKAQVTVTVRG